MLDAKLAEPAAAEPAMEDRLLAMEMIKGIVYPRGLSFDRKVRDLDLGHKMWKGHNTLITFVIHQYRT